MSGERTIEAHGISAAVLDGWEARIYRREPMHPVERTYPVVHLATFALPDDRGDFGAGAVEHMRSDDVFVTLFEYAEASAGKGLFRRRGWPDVRPEHFEPQRLQHAIAGQAGVQYFFSVGPDRSRLRAFCLYIVIGSHARRAQLAARAVAMTQRLAVSAG
jgi:hypothetical protein